MLDPAQLYEMLLVAPEDYSRQAQENHLTEEHAKERLGCTPSKIILHYDKSQLHACDSKSISLEQDAAIGEYQGCSGLKVASRGSDVAQHIGPLHAWLQCRRCHKPSLDALHEAVETVIVLNLQSVGHFSRRMATLMQCKSCLTLGVLLSHDYDDDRDYYMSCDDFICLDRGESKLREWKGLHRFLDVYIVNSLNERLF